MADKLTAERLLLVSEVEVPGDGALVLVDPVLIEAGSTYWLHERQALMVEDAAGRRRRYEGHWEWRCSPGRLDSRP